MVATKPTPKLLSTATLDGPDSALKAAQATNPAPALKQQLRSSRKSVRVVGIEEEEDVEETKKTRGRQREETKNAVVGGAPGKSALKPQNTTEAKGKGKGKLAPTEPVEDCLAGFEDFEETDDDSSDDEDYKEYGDPEKAEPLDSAFLPEVEGKRKQQLDKAKKSRPTPGVVYLGRIPHGFHEAELRGYFSQFGDVRRLRLSRNRRTGASKHYAFLQFTHKEVAQIVAETMDGYLLHGRLLVCKVLSKDEVHPKMWVGAGKTFKSDGAKRAAREKHNEEKTPAQQFAIAARLVRRESAKRKRLEGIGIDYDFPGYATSVHSSSKSANGADDSTSARAEALTRKPKKPKTDKSTDEASLAPMVNGKSGKEKKGRHGRASTGGVGVEIMGVRVPLATEKKGRKSV